MGSSQSLKIQQTAKVGSADRMQAKLDKYPQFINTKDKEGFTPLMLACFGNNYQVVSVLIEKGADINAIDNQVRNR